MGMIGNLLRVSNLELEAYRKDSSILEKRIYGDLGREDHQLARIEKAWAGIIFLLMDKDVDNEEHPLDKVLFSGQLVDENQNMGYGPACYLTPAQVSKLNSLLVPLSTEDLRKNFDPEKMNELNLYPSIWDEGDSAFDYLDHYFKTVKEVYAAAAKNGEALITFIN